MYYFNVTVIKLQESIISMFKLKYSKLLGIDESSTKEVVEEDFLEKCRDKLRSQHN